LTEGLILVNLVNLAYHASPKINDVQNQITELKAEGRNIRPSDEAKHAKKSLHRKKPGKKEPKGTNVLFGEHNILRAKERISPQDVCK